MTTQVDVECRIASLLAEVTLLLDHRRRRLLAEITAYPRPIPACDDQFNHLLQRRAELSRELSLLRALGRRGWGPETRESLRALLLRSPFPSSQTAPWLALLDGLGISPEADHDD